RRGKRRNRKAERAGTTPWESWAKARATPRRWSLSNGPRQHKHPRRKQRKKRRPSQKRKKLLRRKSQRRSRKNRRPRQPKNPNQSGADGSAENRRRPENNLWRWFVRWRRAFFAEPCLIWQPSSCKSQRCCGGAFLTGCRMAKRFTKVMVNPVGIL